ncbi:HEAT repeat domain-containing protein [Sandaracinus amylolyticus]|uniref:HEAT repeat protein n=1 Tax=Sandaracinus amylolyticus TaxID=927083 RepID=A0A0F6YK11_9BACT|nr:HEAT repeat domain-containing protein [Sandaracinus amylolyticus]AKF08335.1 hypothetical protein DB32_005484 [Sandaracinus amylolyticus]
MRLPTFALALALFTTTASVATASVARAQDEVGPGREDPAPPRTRADVIALLSGFESTPTLDAWRAMGPTTIPLLRATIDDARTPGFVRLRAVHALGAFTTSEVRTTLRRLLRRSEGLVVREAVLALTTAFGAASEPDVAPLLSHSDTAVREAAIDALGRMGTAGARSRLQAHLAQERDEVLRERVQERLRGGAGSSPG